MNNCAVTTIEGIGSKKGDLEAIQNEMINTDGSQCGFCTSGMIMTMYTVIRNYKKVNIKEIIQRTKRILLATPFQWDLVRFYYDFL